MCGIAGYVSRRPVDDGVIDRMTDLLAHRGPDGRGVYRAGGRPGAAGLHLALGHRRLSIIDPAGGAQPMFSACGRFVVVFNGEIYNYRELRDQLRSFGHRFNTDSDTEVLLKLYRRYGDEACNRINGMFAFAVADLRDGSLFLARDPFGEKPLYYHATDDAFVFGSEIKSLLAFPTVRRAIDPIALHHYLSLNYVPGERTMFEGVRRLPPGCCMTARSGTAAPGCRINIRRYYEPAVWDSRPRRSADESMQHSMSPDDAADRLGALLDDSVRLRLRSDVPVGVFLSSGLDSSLIASSVARVGGGDVAAFTVAFADPRFDEAPAARDTARRLGLRMHEQSAAPDAAALFDQLVRHADDPLADSSALPTWHLCRATAEHCKVALGGDGADELFGGYLTHRAARVAQWYRRLLPAEARAGLARAARLVPAGSGKVTFGYKLRRFTERAALPAGPAHLAFNGTWLETQKRELYDRDWRHRTVGLDSLEQLAAVLNLTAEPPTLQRILSADQRQYLPDDILTKTDRMAMAHGLEVRSPYLDRRIVEFAAGLPDRLLVGPRTGKVLLRRMARRRGLDDVARRKKQGFSIPVHAWLRTELRDTMLEMLRPDRLAATGVFDPGAVRRHMDAHLAGRDALGFELWGLMVFMSWWGQFIERPVDEPRFESTAPAFAVESGRPTPSPPSQRTVAIAE